MDSPSFFEIADIKIQVNAGQGISLDTHYPEPGQSFVCSNTGVTDQNLIFIRFTKKNHTFAKGQIILSANAQNIYHHKSGYLIQYFIIGKKTKPYLTILINKQYNRFDFHIDQNRYQFFSSDQRLAVNAFYHATNQSLLFPALLNNHAITLHSSGGSILDKGMIFAAPSGTGKSTVARLLLSLPGSRLFSEDRLIIRQQQGLWNIWGTPWHGSGDIARNECAPLAALIFLSQASETKITELSPARALHRLVQVASIPWYSEEWTQKGLALCEQLIQEIPAYELAFTPDKSAVRAVEQLAAAL